MLWILSAQATPVALGPGTDHPDVRVEPDPAVSAEIVNGKRESTFTATVALATDFTGTFCSASMITPQIALTAAHCVSGQQLNPAILRQIGEVRWGTDSEEPTRTAKMVDAITHPGWNPNSQFPANDIAIVVIEEPDFTETVWFNEDEPTDADLDGAYISVGYGVTETGSGSGIKRSAELTVDSIEGVTVVSRNSTNNNNANVCSGDSGGPMYQVQEDGSLLGFAVHSFVAGGQNPCLFSSGSTSTGAYADWILEEVARVHGTDDTCVSRGLLEDARCDEECPADPMCNIEAAAFAESNGACSTATGTGSALGLGLLLLAPLVRRRND